MSKVKRQHYVPKFYLKEWSNSNQQIVVFDKFNKKQFINNIQDVASEKYFYDIGTLPDDEKDKIRKIAQEEGLEEAIEPYLDSNQLIEFMMGKVEALAAPILGKVISRLNGLKAFPEEYLLGHSVIKDSEYYDIAYFISLQAVRTKEHRKVFDEVQKGLIKKLAQLKFKKDKFKNSIEEKIQTEIIQKGNFNVEIDSEYSKSMHVSQIFLFARKLSEILLTHKWLIQRRTSNLEFITSDHPVVKYSNIQNPLCGTGYSNKGIEIHFPLSPDYELLIYERTYLVSVSPFLANADRHIIDSIEQNVIYSNDLQVYSSERQLFTNNCKNFKFVKKRIKENFEIYNKMRIQVI